MKRLYGWFLALIGRAPSINLSERIAQHRATQRRASSTPPGWYPQAIPNKKKRRAALRYWQETGQIPNARQLRAM